MLNFVAAQSYFVFQHSVFSKEALDEPALSFYLLSEVVLFEFFGFQFSFAEFAIIKFLFSRVEEGAKALEFLPGTCVQIFVFEDL